MKQIYFNFFFIANNSRSEEVEHKLERECGQVYSPVRNHKFFQHQSQPKQQQDEPQKPKQNQFKHHPQQVQAQQTKVLINQQQHQQPKKESGIHCISLKFNYMRNINDELFTFIYFFLSCQIDCSSFQRNQQIKQQNQHQQHTFTQPYANLPNVSKVMPSSKLPSQLPIMKECNIEKFAQDNLNLHSKGLFRKKSSIRDMLSWTPDTISRPMLAVSRDKVAKKMATEMFKLVQIYMGDRKARDGMSLNSVAMDIITTALGQPQLRDELYIQLCRQTTENHIRESLIRGWELLTICLSFLPPSPTFQPALLK